MTRGDRWNVLRWTLGAALALAVAVSVSMVSLSLLALRGGSADPGLVSHLALGTAIVGAVCWFLVVEQPNRWETPNRWEAPNRGAIAGALGGFGGPALAMAFGALVGEVGSLGDRVAVALFVALTTALAVGWWALPVGAGTGYLLCRYRQTAVRRDAETA